MIFGITPKHFDTLRGDINQNVFLKTLKLAIGSKLGAPIKSGGRFGKHFNKENRMTHISWRQAVARVAGYDNIGIKKAVCRFDVSFDGSDEHAAWTTF